MNKVVEVVENFLNIYWMRPENAVHRSLDVLQMKNIDFKSPSLDIGCGNGVFSFTRFDGKANMSYDVYSGLNDIANFYKGEDIYNQTTNVKPKILKKPKDTIDIGLDWKQNLLNNADQLGIYKKTIQHNLEEKLPFKDNSFSTVFSNVFYWIDNLKQLLSECHRILKSDGKLILFVPDNKFKKNLIYSEFLKNKSQWAKALDRGNHNNLKQFNSFNGWKSTFKKAGFKIDYHSSYLSERFVQWSQIGHWIYTPPMTVMSNLIAPKIRKQIKQQLIKQVLPIAISYVNYEMNLKKDGTFHLFVLTK